MIKISIFNQKGGTAKTTTTYNLAGYLAKKYQKKILVIDGDPQANISNTLLMETNFNETSPTILDVLTNNKNINEVIQTALIKTRSNAHPKDLGIDILPTNRNMYMVTMDSDYEILNMLEKIEKEYDFILFDCPPYLSQLSINILAATDYVLVPATADKDSLDGYSQLIDSINMLKTKNINAKIKILGIFLTLVNLFEGFDKFIFDKGNKNFGDLFIDTYIRRSTSAKQSIFFGVPLCWFKPKSSIAKDYENLTDIIMQRIKRDQLVKRAKNTDRER